MSCFPCSYCAFFGLAKIRILGVCPFGKFSKIKGKIFWLLPLSLVPGIGLEKAARGRGSGGRRTSYAPGRLGLQRHTQRWIQWLGERAPARAAPPGAPLLLSDGVGSEEGGRLNSAPLYPATPRLTRTPHNRRRRLDPAAGGTRRRSGTVHLASASYRQLQRL